MQLAWTPESVEDREAIYTFIEADNPHAALALDTLISEKAERLLEQPGLGRPGRVPGTRELVFHPNYLLVYDEVQDRLRILRTARRAAMATQLNLQEIHKVFLWIFTVICGYFPR